MKNTPINGIIFLLRGFGMLTRHGLKRFVVIPLLLNIFIYGILIGFGYHYLHVLVNLLTQWLHWLNWLILPLFFLSGGIIMVYTFTIFTNLMSCPFNSWLAEKVFVLQTGKKPIEDDSFSAVIKDIPRTIKREGYKILYFLPRALLLLILFFIPGINIIASFLWFIFGCWMMSLEYVDYLFDLRKKSFSELKLFLRAHCLMCLGFGLGVVICAMIPVINLFVMPAAVIGGALLVIENKT